MFSKINSFSTRGIDGYRITVEVDVSDGLPSFVMVGYLAEEVREAQERVRTALRNAGFCLPPKRITVNLSPAGVRKEGTGCDLAIAAGILRCLWEQGEKAKISSTLRTSCRRRERPTTAKSPSIMWRNTMKPSFPLPSLILCRQNLPAGSRMAVTAE